MPGQGPSYGRGPGTTPVYNPGGRTPGYNPTPGMNMMGVSGTSPAYTPNAAYSPGGYGGGGATPGYNPGGMLPGGPRGGAGQSPAYAPNTNYGAGPAYSPTQNYHGTPDPPNQDKK